LWRYFSPLLAAGSWSAARSCSGVEFAACVGGERLAQDPLVLAEHLAISIAEPLDELRRALDVREEEGDGTTRKMHNGGKIVTRARDRCAFGDRRSCR
jgi:hypothetical protein